MSVFLPPPARSLRRHHERRVKRRVQGYYSGYARGDPRHTGKITHARQMCSCEMCGNPRRYRGELTLQERRQAGRAREEHASISAIAV